VPPHGYARGCAAVSVSETGVLPATIR
jgi:hypothetical protein